MAFAFAATPSWWRTTSFPNRKGVFYVGGVAPSVTFASGATATAYVVRDYYGTVITSGAFSGTTCTPTAPGGGWLPGWYRIYFTGPQTNATYGTSYGATNFCVIVDDSRFPTNPAPGTYSGAGGESRDLITKAIMGMGTSRLTIANAASLASGNDSLAVVQTDLAVTKTYWSATAVQYQDSVRPARRPWVNFPNESVDSLTLPGSSGTYLRAYPATESVNGTTTFVALAAGSVSGAKVTVRSPDASTIVETYDNLTNAAAAETAINAASTYIHVFQGGQPTAGILSATAIGGALWSGVATVVSTLYPDVTAFEGPSNESIPSAETAHRMRLFRGSVKAGNASALAIGPCPVNIADLVPWRAFLAAGGGAWCDEISFHAYNTFNTGTISGRTIIEAFLALLAEYGLSAKPLWDTESNNVTACVTGLYQPRNAAASILYALIWEQYGIPRERTIPWYDVSHGFWSYPAWIINNDDSLQPHAVLYRTLAVETFGQNHAQRLAFGTLGERIFVGSVFRSAGGTTAGTAVLMSISDMPGATVTLTVTGATGSLVLVDAFGRTSTATITDGRVVVPVRATPTYVRLPSGAAVSVYSCNDWPALSTLSQGAAARGSAYSTLGGQLRGGVTDGSWITDYAATVADGRNLVRSAITVPDTLTIPFPTPQRGDRVVIWCGVPLAYQNMSSLLDFDVQTSVDGTTWVTQATVVNSTATSIAHATATVGTNCSRESYWDGQWIFDVPFPTGPVTCMAIRVVIRAVSYGGCPDAVSTAATFTPETTPHVSFQEVQYVCDDNTRPQFVRGS